MQFLQLIFTFAAQYGIIKGTKPLAKGQYIMSREYVENRIKEALRLSGGSEGKAARQIHAWLYEDHKFLLELTRPHLGGIVAYSVARTKTKMLTDGKEGAAAKSREEEELKAAKEAAAKAKKKEPGFGESILRSFVSDKAARFGHESSAAPVRKKTASQSHIDTMHMLAAAAKKKSNTSASDDEK